MKIISKHKDYYDGVSQSVGIDNHIQYIRNNEEREEYFDYYLPYTDKHIQTNKSIYYKFCIVGVAGKLYPLLVKKNNLYNINNTTTEYIYDIEQIKETHNQLWNQKEKWILRYNNWNNYIDLLNNKTILNYFHEYKVGSFIITKCYGYSIWKKSEYKLELEPILNNIQFYKQIDAFTLFNEMSMFISEQLNTEIDNHPMSDIQKVKSKGFDDKYGFRTRPKK